MKNSDSMTPNTVVFAKVPVDPGTSYTVVLRGVADLYPS